jgi:hypothetical protein
MMNGVIATAVVDAIPDLCNRAKPKASIGAANRGIERVAEHGGA